MPDNDHVTAPTRPTGPASPSRPSLRERKKIQTRRAIRRAAYRLFEAQGYDGTTVEQIADAAEVSASTVFRYFPTKEDIVLTDEYDPVMVAALRDRPVTESIAESVRHALLGPLREMFTDPAELDEMRQRLRLVRTVPAIRARMGENIQESSRLLAAITAERLGRPEDDFEIRVVVGALVGAWTEAIFHWIDAGGGDDLAAILDRALTLLAANLNGR
ncbi:TetR family transcriptional regulator [Streptomyces sp. NPDC058691]|uniref:acyl-CoA-like ligand-binding transcription factor n=1 Tax=Streptomyces sp. NPDC058691 TaxID=3346601 RepID=UPI00364DAD9B